MTFLLDTNVISEARRKAPDARVLTWLRQADPASLYISVLSLGEIVKGAEALARRDPAAARPLREWLVVLRLHYADRLIGIDGSIVETWGRIASTRPLPVIDGLLAATAVVRGMIFVTRNTSDIADTGAATLNPWIV